jgi:SAM-dependent methyltransferase
LGKVFNTKSLKQLHRFFLLKQDEGLDSLNRLKTDQYVNKHYKECRMKKALFHRTTCRLCNSERVELVVPLAPIPLPDKYVMKSQKDQESEVYPIDLYMCLDCSHVQVLDVIHPDILWDSDFSYHSGLSPDLVDHFEQVTNKIIDRYKIQPDSLVLDIGSNDGSFLKFFKKRHFRVLGIDPAKEIAQKANDAGLETIVDLFTPNVAQQLLEKYGPAKIITAFNVFAHSDDMAGMVKSIHHMLTADGIFIFEAQYLLDIIDKMLLGTIFHEHMCHHSVKPMVQFLRLHGLEVIDVERVPIQHGSIVGYAQKVGGSYNISSSVDQLLRLEKERKLDDPETIKQFGYRLSQLKKHASELISKLKAQGATIMGYGAARSAPTFITQLGLDGISYIFDDHPQKVNKYTPGHRIPVIPTAELYSRMPDYVIVLAWVHERNIIKNNIDYLKKGGRFVVCWPEVRVIGEAEAKLL